MASAYSLSAFSADKIFIDFLYQYAGYNEQDLPTLHKAVLQGDLAIESVVENAVSKVGNIKRVKRNGEDFEDGSDAKKATAMNQAGYYNYNKSTRISTKNKKGLLRILVLDPDIKKIFFFKIPYSVYSYQKYIRIPFAESGGKPNFRSDNYVGQSYWNCQVQTFEELCS